MPHRYETRATDVAIISVFSLGLKPLAERECVRTPVLVYGFQKILASGLFSFISPACRLRVAMAAW